MGVTEFYKRIIGGSDDGPEPPSPPEPPKMVTDKERIDALKEAVRNMKREGGARPQEIPARPPFHAVDGTTVRDPEDLAQACTTMRDETFRHHVTENRNDFAQWISDAFHDEELAALVLRARNPAEISHAIIHREELPQLPKATTFHGKPDVQAYQAEIEVLREELDVLRESFDKEIASGLEHLRNTHEAHQQATKNDEQRLREREEHLAMREKELAARETTLAEQRKRIEQDRASVAQQRQDVEAMLSDLKRVREARQSTGTKAHQITAHSDIVERHEHTEPNEAYALLAHVEAARRMLNQGRIPEAKNAYAEIRQAFYHARLPAQEKHQLYNIIRELYADIEMTMLN